MTYCSRCSGKIESPKYRLHDKWVCRDCADYHVKHHSEDRPTF